MQRTLGAPIYTLEEFVDFRPQIQGTLAATSGGFDPIHPGHISCIRDSKLHADTLVVIVNGDDFLRRKKGKPFQDLETRSLIVSSLPWVDYVVMFEIENDPTVCVALEEIRPEKFTKGGDRTGIENIPEWTTCQQHGIEIVTSVGDDKEWSSSTFLADWIRDSAG